MKWRCPRCQQLNDDIADGIHCPDCGAASLDHDHDECERCEEAVTLADGGTVEEDDDADDSEDDPFPFEPGADVRVRVRENGTSGRIVAKFEAECEEIRDAPIAVGSPRARFALPWGIGMESTTLRPYEAEFEVIDGGE